MMAAASRVFYFRFDNVDKAFISRIQSSLSLIWLVRPCTNQCRFALLGSDSEKLLFSNNSFEYSYIESQTSVYKGYKQDKIEMRGDRAEMSDFPLYLNTVAGGLDRRDQTIGGFSFVVKIYAVPVVEIIG